MTVENWGILNLDTTEGWAVSFTLLPIYLGGKRT